MPNVMTIGSVAPLLTLPATNTVSSLLSFNPVVSFCHNASRCHASNLETLRSALGVSLASLTWWRNVAHRCWWALTTTLEGHALQGEEVTLDRLGGWFIFRQPCRCWCNSRMLNRTELKDVQLGFPLVFGQRILNILNSCATFPKLDKTTSTITSDDLSIAEVSEMYAKRSSGHCQSCGESRSPRRQLDSPRGRAGASGGFSMLQLRLSLAWRWVVLDSNG